MGKIKESELLPEHYEEVKEPYYEGSGNHNILELEEICERYKELVHQLRVREASILNKFGIEIISNDKCKCGEPGRKKHDCPYQADVNNDSETMCNCCIDCTNECLNDI